jgi:hypothetical protein
MNKGFYKNKIFTIGAIERNLQNINTELVACKAYSQGMLCRPLTSRK